MVDFAAEEAAAFAVGGEASAGAAVVGNDFGYAVGEGVGKRPDGETAAGGDAQGHGDDKVGFTQAEDEAFQAFLAASGGDHKSLNHNPEGEAL